MSCTPLTQSLNLSPGEPFLTPELDFETSNEIAQQCAEALFERLCEHLEWASHERSGDFFNWLDVEGVSPMDDPFSQDAKKTFPWAMRDVDFVYLVLLQLGKTTKKNVASNYENHFADQEIGLDTAFYYGFDLEQFQPFDPVTGSERGNPQPGDILVGMSGSKPVHVQLLSTHNERWGWYGMGIWDLDTPPLHHLTLTMIQEWYFEKHPGENLSFVWCPYEVVINSAEIRPA